MSLEQMNKSDLVKEARQLTQQLKEMNQKVKELEQQLVDQTKEVQVLSAPKEETINFPLRGLSVFKQNKKSFIALLQYNLDTMEARVEKVVDYGEEYKASYEANKILVSMEKQVYTPVKKGE